MYLQLNINIFTISRLKYEKSLKSLNAKLIILNIFKIKTNNQKNKTFGKNRIFHNKSNIPYKQIAKIIKVFIRTRGS